MMKPCLVFLSLIVFLFLFAILSCLTLSADTPPALRSQPQTDRQENSSKVENSKTPGAAPSSAPALADSTPNASPQAQTASVKTLPPAAGQISVKAEVNKAFITIGDPVDYTLTVKHAPSVQVLSSFSPPEGADFKIKKIQDIKKKEGEQIVEGRKFTLTTFALGEYVLDPAQVQFRIGGGDIQSVSTDKIYLTVKSVSAGEQKTDIRGVKSVIRILQKLTFWFILAGFFALTIIGLLLYKRLRKGPIQLLPQAPPLTAEEEAMASLNQLFDSDLIRNGKIKEYYLRLSEILRIYFEKRFVILAIESTTDEIMRALRQKEVDPSLREKIAAVLENADLAKFAKWKPEPAQVVLINQQAKQVIELAKPQEEKPHGI